jgi:sensor histidine kinase YesM
MNRKKVRYLHVFIWLFAAFANLPFSGISAGMPARQMVSYIIGFLYLMVVFYLFYLWIAPLFLNRKNLSGFLVTSFLVVMVMPFFGYLLLFLSRAIFDGTFSHFLRGYSLRMHMSGFYPVLTAAVFGSFFRAIINWFDTLNQKADLDRQKLAVELDLLKSKLNPHFLFNTLNNIDSLIQTDTEKASAALIKLSGMMRYLTYETGPDRVELEKEISYIGSMIELYGLRLKDPETIRFEFRGDRGAMISPGLFVPLIENAFKHSSLRSGRYPVEINLVSEGGIVSMTVSNYCDTAINGSREKDSGYGLSNLRRRLDLIYPGKHELSIEKSGLQFVAKLIIDTNGN